MRQYQKQTNSKSFNEHLVDDSEEEDHDPQFNDRISNLQSNDQLDFELQPIVNLQ